MTDRKDVPFLPRRRDVLSFGSAGVLTAWGVAGSSDARAFSDPDSALPESVNVRTLGATGDGRTDDTKALQRALDYGTRVIVPPGSYRITAGLKIRRSGTVLEGANAANTRIVGAFDGDALLASADQGTTLLWCRVANIGFVANGAVAAVIDWRSMQFGEIARCWLYGNGGREQAAILCGVRQYGAQECTFNRFQDNYLGNTRYGYRVGDGANANHIAGGRAQLEMAGAVGASFAATHPNGINGWTIIGFCCEHPKNGMTGLSFGGNVWDMYVGGCRFEQLKTAIQIGPGNQRITLVGNAYSSNTQNVSNRGTAAEGHRLLDAGDGVARAAP